MKSLVYTVITAQHQDAGVLISFWAVAAESQEQAQEKILADPFFNTGWLAVYCLSDWAAERTGGVVAMNTPPVDFDVAAFNRWERWATQPRLEDDRELGPTYVQVR